MIPIFNLKANLRTNLGSSDSRRVRKAGQIPAVIYGKNGQNLNIVVDAKDFEYQYFRGNILTTIAHLDLAGEKFKAISRKIELNPVTDKPEHVDFIRFNDGETIKSKPKLNFINKDKSIGLKKGGFLHIILRNLEVLCDSNTIPNSIDVDVSVLRVGDKIRGKDLQLPDGVKLAKKDDFLVASIIGRGTKDEEVATADGTTAITSATAEGKSSAKSPAASDKKDAVKKDAPKKPADKK